MTETAELSEIVPEPAEGRVFEEQIEAGFADATAGGRVRLDAVARWLQDFAAHDSVDAGMTRLGAWIVRRLRIRVEAFPRYGETLTLRTFCSGLGRFTAERRTSIVSAKGRIETVALWVLLDWETGRPLRLPEEFKALYAVSANGRDAAVTTRHPAPPDDATESEWLFRATDLDPNDHVNNSHYWDPLEEELAGSDPQSVDAEVEFRDPARSGPARLLRSGSGMWITANDGALHASLLIGA